MSALSIRLTPEIEKRLEIEVGRLKVTKSRFVQDLLENALTPKDAVALLMQARAQFGLDTLAQTAPTTYKAGNVKALAREAVQKKHASAKAGVQAGLQVDPSATVFSPALPQSNYRK